MIKHRLSCVLSFIILMMLLAPFAFAATYWSQYITSVGTLQDGFENVADWTLAGVGGVKTADTSNFVEGTQSINITSVNGVGTYITKTINTNFASVSNFPVWVYIVNKTTINNIACYIAEDSGFAKYFIISMTGVGMINGWNHLDIPKQNFTTSTGASWSNNMVRVRFRVNPQSTATAIAEFDWWTTNLQARAKCIITFDDIWATCYDKAYPIMNSLGFAGVSFVIVNNVGTAGFLTAGQLTTMYSAGWDISDHSYTHVDLTSVSQSTLDYETSASYTWLLQNGFSRSAKFFAYPYGGYNDTVITSVARYHMAARTVHNGAWQPHMLSPTLSNTQYLLKTLLVTNITTTTEVQAYIDGTIQENGLLILTFHKIVDAGADFDTYYLTADFTTIMNYLSSHSANIDVTTLSGLTYTISDTPARDSIASSVAAAFSLFTIVVLVATIMSLDGKDRWWAVIAIALMYVTILALINAVNL